MEGHRSSVLALVCDGGLRQGEVLVGGEIAGQPKRVNFDER